MTDRPDPGEVSGSANAGSDPTPATPESPGVDADTPDAAAKRHPAPKESERVIVRDRRKIDPNGTKGRPAASPAAGGAAPEETKGKPRPGPTSKASAAGAHTAPSASESAEPSSESAEPSSESAEPSSESAERATGSRAGTAGAGLWAELEVLRTALDERTRDLQRITAEYANYRKRVERDRGLVAEQVTGNVLSALLPILDDLDRAREHGDLVGPFATVAEQLAATTAKFGLTAFGEKGDPFDPTRHEAVAHLTSADVTEPTCVDVLRRGYLLGQRLLRPAMVAVADPE